MLLLTLRLSQALGPVSTLHAPALGGAARNALTTGSMSSGRAVRLIHTVYGQGYVLRAPEPPDLEDDRPAG
jgi:hypothetical protein